MSANEDVEVESEDRKEQEEEKDVDKSVDPDDAEIEALKKKVQEMEEEDEKLRKMQDELESSSDGGSKEEADTRSIYIGQVDYSTTPEELQSHFHSCGTINRVTILCDKFTGQPKGYAYIEFADKDAVTNAILLNETLFKGRQLKVSAKRTNVHGLVPRGGRGGFMPRGGRGGYYGYQQPYFAPRGRGFRGRGRGGYFHPYS